MRHLFEKYLEDQCSAEEVRELLAYFNEPGNETALRELISRQLQAEDALEQEPLQWRVAAANVHDRLNRQIAAEDKKVIPLYKKTWVRVAAAVVLFLSAGSYFYFDGRKAQPAATNETQMASKTDIAPGGNKAVLTLANGSSIILDSVQNGMLARQGNTNVRKIDDGKIVYDQAAERSEELAYNKITTPRGGQYELTLSDGSKVWLDAASSIRYPVTFVGKERKVEITGEAYFEIAKDPSRPFHVMHDKLDVEVLGTHFNVNSYDDEQQIKVTLLEGSVQLSSGTGKMVRLTPGAQGRMKRDGELSLTDKIDMTEVMAWKEGQFRFKDADLRSIMRQIARWYDVEVEFKGNVDDRSFTADISRNKNLSTVLKIFGMSNIHCRVENRKLIVMP